MTNNTNRLKIVFLMQIQLLMLIFLYDLIKPLSDDALAAGFSSMPNTEDYTHCNSNTIDDWISQYASIGDSTFLSKKPYIDKFKHMYGFYFGQKRNEPLRILSLDLGCSSNPLAIWRTFLNDIDRISALETDKECRFALSKQANMIYEDTTTYFGNENRLDIVVDSGARSSKEQEKMLKLVWPKIKSNGVYIIEDIRNGGLEIVKKLAFFLGEGNTYRIRNVPGYFNLAWFDQLYSIFSSLLSIECFAEACVLVKV